MVMNNNKIKLERENKIAIVTMDRPDKKNAFDGAMFDSMEKIARELKKDLPRAVVLTGAGGKSFCSGFDVSLDNPMTEKFLEAVNKNELIHI